MSPEALARELERVGAELHDAARSAVSETLESAQALAQRYSSGPLSRADLIAQDHPYARRHGAPQAEPSIINVDTGRFRDAWEIDGPSEAGGTVRGALWNASPEAEFLETGTTFMFERPIADRVALEIEPVFQEKAERRISEVLHG